MLAMASAYLSKCLQRVSHGHELDWRTLHTSLELFIELRDFPSPHAYFGKISHLSALLGIAVATQLEVKLDSVLKAWQNASHAPQAFLRTGFTDMIFAYPTSELRLRRGASAQSELLSNYAKTLCVKSGRKHHFVSLESYWPEVLYGWFAARGRGPIIPVG